VNSHASELSTSLLVTTVDAVEANQLPSTQEVLHSTFGWKSHGHNFLDCKGVLLVDYLPQKTTMTGPYYGEVLSGVAQAVLKDIRFEQLSHPPYSPDLALSDF